MQTTNTTPEVVETYHNTLKSYIERHNHDARINGAGELQGYMIYTRRGEDGHIASFGRWETIAPTFAAVRDWLGY
jgi:hypothetical protein